MDEREGRVSARAREASLSATEGLQVAVTGIWCCLRRRHDVELFYDVVKRHRGHNEPRLSIRNLDCETCERLSRVGDHPLRTTLPAIARNYFGTLLDPMLT
jgi:hypothetical protein